MTPPPRVINKLFLSALNSVRAFQTPPQVSKFLLISPDSISIISIRLSVSSNGMNTG